MHYADLNNQREIVALQMQRDTRQHRQRDREQTHKQNEMLNRRKRLLNELMQMQQALLDSDPDCEPEEFECRSVMLLRLASVTQDYCNGRIDETDVIVRLCE